VRRFAAHPCEDAPKTAARLREWEALYGKGRFLLENTAAGLPGGFCRCLTADGGRKPLRDGDKWLAGRMPFLRGFTGIVSIGLFDWDGI
jgi:hypothetical protein